MSTFSAPLSRFGLFVVFLVLIGGCVYGPPSATRTTTTNPADHTGIVQNYGKLPFSFEANQGQTDPEVKFLARGPGYSLFLKPTEAVLTLHKPNPKPDKLSLPGGEKARPRGESAGDRPVISTAIRMTLAGASPDARLEGADALPGQVNYLKGNDPKQWKTGIPTYAKVKASQVYPGIDLVYYGNPQQLEYDFVVAPGADPKQIRWAFEGLDQPLKSKPEIDEQGNLLLKTASGDFRVRKPVVYQEIGGRRRAIEGIFALRESGEAAEIGFRLAGYDPSYAVVIDPEVVFSTYLGGSNTDSGTAIAVDNVGNIYVVGSTLSYDFPQINAKYSRRSLDWGSDAFIFKLSRDGKTVIYSTYLGGSDTDNARDVAVDDNGNSYVAGWTSSQDFPTTVTGNIGYNRVHYAFAAQLSNDGKNLIYSAYIVGNNVSTRAHAIAVDKFGNAYLTGETGVLEILDVFFAKLDQNANLVYGGTLGGYNTDRGYDISVDSEGFAYITGEASYGFPKVNSKYPSCTLKDAFALKLSVDGKSVLYSTCLGGSNEDAGYSITTDDFGNAYITGYTKSPDFPSINALHSKLEGSQDAFIVKLNNDGQTAQYSTYLGGASADYGSRIVLDNKGNIYVTGTTGSIDFPKANASYPNLWGPSDAFVFKLSGDGQSTLYSTYLGGNGDESGSGLTVDSNSNIYVAGETNSVDFPKVNSIYPNLWGPSDAFIIKLSDTAPPSASVDLSIANSDTPDPVTAGSELTYTLSISNAGPNTATGVTLTDQWVAGVTFVSASPGCTTSSNSMTCALGDLPKGASATVTLVVRPAAAGGISNTATVSAGENDPNPSNNTSTAITTISVPVPINRFMHQPLADQSAGLMQGKTRGECLFGGYCARGAATESHNGIDYGAAAGTPVYAICDGIVKIARNKKTTPNIWNRFTIIEHTDCGDSNKLVAYYGHMDAKVKEGQRVTAGEQIGSVGNWGSNSHLHLSLKSDYVPRGWGYVGIGKKTAADCNETTVTKRRESLASQGWLDPAEVGASTGWNPFLLQGGVKKGNCKASSQPYIPAPFGQSLPYYPWAKP